MAYITREVDPNQIAQILRDNHGLNVGDAAGRANYSFTEMSGGRQSVEVELTFVLSPAEVNALLG